MWKQKGRDRLWRTQARQNKQFPGNLLDRVTRERKERRLSPILCRDNYKNGSAINKCTKDRERARLKEKE